ncbi:carboxypeptidase-like regulatory domain-containing protein [Crocinitomix catalasitica]|uniref:carboxypeptidase-like regulatory domain-containing protein n=1 Tax=Crocinitomix catalasitica TaxID=184607 RepID=UPI000485AEFE|nr:carboxypeptidase-like regulatory domain-containing protein [Crocinitomix catalasitica]
MHKYLFFILFFQLANFVIGQNIVIEGTVVDENGSPVKDVRYFFKNDQENTFYSTESGKFNIKYTIGEYDSLIFVHVGFQKQIIAINKELEKKIKNRSLNLTVALSDLFLKEFDVFASKPDTVIGSSYYSVADFELLENGELLLLTYSKKLNKDPILRWVRQDKTEKAIKYIDREVDEIKRDFRNKIHLIANQSVYSVGLMNKNIHVVPENQDVFYTKIQPIIDTIGEKIYFSNYLEQYPAFNYYEFDRKDSIYKTMMKVEDVELMEFYRAEFKYVDVRTKLWAHNKELSTGIDKEIWVGANVFANSAYYHPLYAPLFKTNDSTVLIFDHYKNVMFRYSPTDGFVDSVSIDYHLRAKKSGWEQPLIQDEITKKIYGVFFRNGFTYLSELNLETGRLEKPMRLFYKYVENIQIKGGEVYYIYRPYESIQKKYLYKERL